MCLPSTDLDLAGIVAGNGLFMFWVHVFANRLAACPSGNAGYV